MMGAKIKSITRAFDSGGSLWLRLILLGCAVVLAAGLALLPGEASLEKLVREFGYYFAFFSFILFVGFIGLALLRRRRGLLSWLGQNRLGLVSVFVGAWVLFVHSEFDYKIAMDDYLLSATAKTMHLEREVAYVSFGREISGDFTAIDYQVDKRQWMYPFLVASLHDLVGYNQGHPFVVNALLGVGLLILVYWFGAALGGQFAGALSVLLWASLPLLSDNTNGAGMEMLNLFLIQLVLVLSVDYLREPTRLREGALSLALLLLTCTRYESGMFALPVFIVIVIGWIRRKEILLSWASIASVLLLVGHIWQLRRYAMTPESWEIASSSIAPFSLANLANNLPHALNFFGHLGGELPNSLLLSLLGFVSVIAFPFVFRSEVRRYWSNRPAGIVLTAFAPFLLLHLVVVLCFHDGRLDSLFVSRYALPVHVFFVAASIALLSHVAVRYDRLWRYALLLSLVYIHSFTLPTLLNAIPTRSNFLVNEFNWMEVQAREHLPANSLFIDRFTTQWTLNEFPALTPQVAVTSAARIAQERTQEKYKSVYLVERLVFDGETFVGENPALEQLKEIYTLELVSQRSFRPLRLTRLYEMKGLRSE